MQKKCIVHCQKLNIFNIILRDIKIKLGRNSTGKVEFAKNEINENSDCPVQCALFSKEFSSES